MKSCTKRRSTMRKPEPDAGRRNGAIRSTRSPRQKISPPRRSRRDFRRRKSARNKRRPRESSKSLNESNKSRLRLPDAKKRSKGSVRSSDDNKRLKSLLSADVSKKRKERPEKSERQSEQDSELPEERGTNQLQEKLLRWNEERTSQDPDDNKKLKVRVRTRRE